MKDVTLSTVAQDAIRLISDAARLVVQTVEKIVRSIKANESEKEDAKTPS